jgi:hypothetical protein
MKPFKINFILAFFLIAVFAFCETGETEKKRDYDSLFSLKLTPTFTIPVTERDLFGPGGGFDLYAELKLPPFPILFFQAGFGYYISATDGDATLSTLPFGAGIGFNWEITKGLNLGAFGRFGYFYSFLNDKSGEGGGNPFVSAGAYFYFKPIPAFSIGIESAFRSYTRFYSDITISIGASYNFKPFSRRKEAIIIIEKGVGLEIYDIDLDSIFPVFYGYYDDHPIGVAVLHNWEKSTIKDIRLTIFQEQYMTDPKVCDVPEELEPGEKIQIDLLGLFNDSILEVTEGTKVSLKITLEYTLQGKSYKRELIETLSMYDRNALSWDDDRKASVFVTAKDPTVLKFSKYVANLIEGEVSSEVNENLLKGMAMYEALRIYGLKYVIDPSTPYKDFSEDTQAVDFLQFPKQTLEYKAGDCDDLSVLYCALMESIGVETAFVTVPGHIFVAFSLNLTPAEAKKFFSKPDDLIYMDNKMWVPVELTLLNEGFLKAWQSGASQWREHTSKMQASFYAMHDSWEIYKPVGFSEDAEPIVLPDSIRVLNVFNEELELFVNREIIPQVAILEEAIKNSNEDPKYINSLGVLYVRYGFTEKAMAEFNKILAQEEYTPALINMGNIYYLKEDYINALIFYERAYNVAPDNSTVLLCMARVNHSMEDYETTEEYYDRLQGTDPDLASRFAYLELEGEESFRAADISGVKGVVIWEEE